MDDAWTRNDIKEWAGDTSGHDPNLRRQAGAKGLFESFSSMVTLRCHSVRFPHPHLWIRHCSGFVLDKHFHYKGREQDEGRVLMKRMPTVGHPWSSSPPQLMGLHFGNGKLLPCLHKPHVYSSRRQSRAKEEAGMWMIKWNVVWVSMLNGIEGSLCRTDREEARGKFCREINVKPSIISQYVYFQSEFCNHFTPTPIWVFHFTLIGEIISDNLHSVTAPP